MTENITLDLPRENGVCVGGGGGGGGVSVCVFETVMCLHACSFCRGTWCVVECEGMCVTHNIVHAHCTVY